MFPPVPALVAVSVKVSFENAAVTPALPALISAAKLFHSIRGYGVTFEYVLIEKITDGVENAKRLIDLLTGIPCKINLIPYNQFDSEKEFRRPSPNRLKEFYEILKKSRIGFTIRESRGRDIDAACGQLIQKTASLQ